MKALQKNIKIKDIQVSRNLKWVILRLLRWHELSLKELCYMLDKIYLGYWAINHNLISKKVEDLKKHDLIREEKTYKITDKGLEVLEEREKRLKKYDRKIFTKQACANYSLGGNAGLSAFEFAIGFLSGSIGLIADAVHTGIDIIASAITWIGIKINKEAQAGIVGGVVLFGIGGLIVYESIKNIFKAEPIAFQAIALVTIIINIIINGLFSFYKFYVGGKTLSMALIADAYHTKTDIWSSVAVLIGLVGATFGLYVLDSIAGMVVSLFILYGSYELIIESIKVLKGKDPDMEKFSRFLASHLKALTSRGAFVSLWLLNLKDMTKKENLDHIKRGFGRRFPVGLEDKDYEEVYKKLKENGYIESKDGKLTITLDGLEELRRLANMKTPFLGMLQPRFLNAKKIHWFSQGL